MNNFINILIKDYRIKRYLNLDGDPELVKFLENNKAMSLRDGRWKKKSELNIRMEF